MSHCLSLSLSLSVSVSLSLSLCLCHSLCLCLSLSLLFDRSVCLLACLIGQLLYLALFNCFLVCSPDWLFSLFLMLVYFSSLGLSLFQRVTVALPGTACCLYPCISMRVFLHSPPPPLSLPSVCLSVCQPACLTVCLSVCLPVCLSVCLSVPVSLPPPPLSPLPPLPLSLSLSSSPSFSTSLPPSPCVLCPLFFNLFCFGFSLVVLFLFSLLCVFFFFGFVLPHVQVLSVCNIALAVCILSS